MILPQPSVVTIIHGLDDVEKNSFPQTHIGSFLLTQKEKANPAVITESAFSLLWDSGSRPEFFIPSMVAGDGVEPSFLGYEPSALPLGHPAIYPKLGISFACLPNLIRVNLLAAASPTWMS